MSNPFLGYRKLSEDEYRAMEQEIAFLRARLDEERARAERAEQSAGEQRAAYAFAFAMNAATSEESRHEATKEALAAAEAKVPALVEVLKKANTFIEYAAYVLEPGLAEVGDQFPRQEDAMKISIAIQCALSLTPAAALDRGRKVETVVEAAYDHRNRACTMPHKALDDALAELAALDAQPGR